MNLSRQEGEVHVTSRTLLSVAAIALVWTSLMGTSGLFLQTSDHIFHNAKFQELSTGKWPILIPQKQTFTCYYYGYYLLPAFLSRLVGHVSLPIIFVFTWIGIFLGLIWFYLLMFRSLTAIITFIICGGVMFSLENLSLALFGKSISYNPLLSVFIQSLYTPNQIISALIPTGIFLFYSKDLRKSFYPITLSFFWGVFPALCLILLAGLSFCINLFNKEYPTLRTLMGYYIIPSLLFVPVFVFLTSSNSVPVNGFFSFDSIASLAPFADCLLIMLLIIGIGRYKLLSKDLIPMPVIISALILMTVLLTYQIGIYNDLFLRGSIPLFITIFTGLIQRVMRNYDNAGIGTEHTALSRAVKFIRMYPVIAVFLTVGSLASLYQLRQLGRFNVLRGTYKPLAIDAYPNSYNALWDVYGNEGANQYVGNPKSFYFLHLAPVNASNQ